MLNVNTVIMNTNKMSLSLNSKVSMKAILKYLFGTQ